MNWRYEYTPYIWPALIATTCMAVLALYAWRRRFVPGAVAFATTLALCVPWALGEPLVLAAVDPSAKIFWAKFRFLWILPITTAALCFVVDYTDIEGRLNRRKLWPLGIPPLLVWILAFTNGTHHVLWRGFAVSLYVYPVYGIGGWVHFGYALTLIIAVWIAFLWLYVRSPAHGRMIVLCLSAQFIVLVATVFGRFTSSPVDPVVPAVCLATGFYSLILFHFHVLDLIPVARSAVIDQMLEGVMVLDCQRRIVDLNPAAERIIGVAAGDAIGRDMDEVLPPVRAAETEIALGSGDDAREYLLRHSALQDRRGIPLGSVLLLFEVTARKRAEAELLQQRSAVAMLQERDRVGRELHDGLAQVLAFVKMQVDIALKLLPRNDASKANGCLARVAAAVLSAQTDVRHYILGARAGVSTDPDFLQSLRQYVRRFKENTGMFAELSVDPDLKSGALEPTVGAQLLWIIQEALTNVRKHAQARAVAIRIGADGGHVQVVVQDDGSGFDPMILDAEHALSFGLQYMRERAQDVGGSVGIRSAPDQGTTLTIKVPLRTPRR